MVILEMSGPVNGCALNILLQQVINNSSGITSETPLTRMGESAGLCVLPIMKPRLYIVMELAQPWGKLDTILHLGLPEFC